MLRSLISLWISIFKFTRYGILKWGRATFCLSFLVTKKYPVHQSMHTACTYRKSRLFKTYTHIYLSAAETVEINPALAVA